MPGACPWRAGSMLRDLRQRHALGLLGGTAALIVCRLGQLSFIFLVLCATSGFVVQALLPRHWPDGHDLCGWPDGADHAFDFGVVQCGHPHGVLLRAQILNFDSRSEEHTSELQSLMRISYAVFCLKKKNQ